MIKPEIVTINNVDTVNGTKVEVNVWAITNDPDAHPAGIVVYVEAVNSERTMEFTLTAAEVAELLSNVISYMPNKAVRIPFDGR